MTVTKSKPGSLILKILYAVILFVGFLCFFSGRYYVSTFGKLGFDSVLYTLSAGLGGVQSGQITGWLLRGFLPAVALTALTYFLLSRMPRKQKKGKYKKNMIQKNDSVYKILKKTVFNGVENGNLVKIISILNIKNYRRTQ